MDLRERVELQSRSHALTVEESQLADASKERHLMNLIADYCPNPLNLYEDRGRFVDSMKIMCKQEPYLSIFNQISVGLIWKAPDHVLRCTLEQFFDSIWAAGLTHGMPGRSHETFLQDQLALFFRHLTSPTMGRCFLDRTSLLMSGYGVSCAIGHFQPLNLY
jgi:hypothetical protein